MEQNKTVEQLESRIKELENNLKKEIENSKFYYNEYNKIKVKYQSIVSLLNNLVVLSNS